MGGPQVGIQQHFLGGDADGRVLGGGERFGQLDRLRVIFHGLAVIGLGARGRDVAQQAEGAGLDVRSFGAEVDGLLGLVGRFLQGPAMSQHLGLRHPVMCVLWIESDGLGAGGDGLLIFAQRSQHAAAQPVRPGCWWPEAAAPGRGRGG